MADPVDELAKNFGRYGVAAEEVHNLKSNKFQMRLLVDREAAPEIIERLQEWLADTDDTNRGYYINFDMKGLSHATRSTQES